MKQVLLVLSSLVLFSVAHAAQTLVCNGHMTDDNGFGTGILAFTLKLDGSKSTIDGLSDYTDNVRSVKKSGKFVTVLGYNAAFQFNVWVPVSGAGKAGTIKGVLLTEYTGAGNYDGKFTCKSTLN